MSELPDGWIKVPLGEVNEFSGSTVNPASRPDELFELYSVPSFPTGKPERLLGSEIGSTKQTVEAGDVLISKINPRINRVWTVGPKSSEEQIASSEWIGFRSEAVKPAFANYYFRSQEFRDLLCSEVAGVGGSLTRAQPKRVAAYPLPIAPLAEQTRIADQLDTLLARVNACNDHLDAIPGILKRFRRAVLEFATCGQLTSEWRVIHQIKSGVASGETLERLEQRRVLSGAKKKFKEPTLPDLTHWRTKLPDSWAVESVSAFAECLDHLRVPVSKAKRAVTKGLYPYYGANGQVDLVDDYLFDDELVLVTEDETFYGREKPIAYRSSGRCWVNNHAHVLHAGDHNRSDYLCFALMYYDVEPWLTGTTGRAKLTQGALNSLPIAVPPQAEIEEIVRQVKRMFKFADEIEARLARAQLHTQRLAPQALAKAFRGELVEQDPKDESASVLLQRLAATPSAKAPSTRGRPRAQPQVPATLPAPQAPAPIDWHTLPNNEWAAPAAAQDQAITVCLTAVLKAWGQPMPELDARLATLLCQQPRVFTAMLPPAQAKEWGRLVGEEAKPLPAQVARLQPASNSPWGQAIKRMRARGDLVEAGSADDTTWSLGPGASAIVTAGWPDGRAAFVVAYLRAHGVASILPALAPADQAFVHVRAA